MKKYLVISDIHGALEGAKAMEEAFAYHHCDTILCLGDVLYHGPRNDLPSSYAPKDVIPVMNGHKDHIIAVRGNCEAEVDQMVLEFPVLADYNTLFYEDHRIFMTHGHIYTPDNPPSLPEGSLFLSGHTHLPVAQKREGILFGNPGSVSIPKGGHPHSYGLVDERGFTVYTLDHTEYMHVDW